MAHRTGTALGAAVLLGVAGYAHADAFFLEGDFEPGTWEDGGAIPDTALEPGDTVSSVSDRFIGGMPGNAFMLQQITIGSEDGTWGARTPVWMNEFVYTPSVDGAIESIGGAITTLQATSGLQPEHRATARVFAQQDGQTYMLLDILTTGVANSLNAPDAVNFFSGATADDFALLLPGGGADLGTIPDFSASGSEIRFGFGFGITQPLGGLTPLAPTTFVGAFDDVSLRISAVPTPGALAALGVLGVSAARRRRR